MSIIITALILLAAAIGFCGLCICAPVELFPGQYGDDR